MFFSLRSWLAYLKILRKKLKIVKYLSRDLELGKSRSWGLYLSFITTILSVFLKVFTYVSQYREESQDVNDP